MLAKAKLLFAVPTLAISFLAGCATDVEPIDEEKPVVAPATESSAVDPQQMYLTGPCTVTTSCNATTCCTTTDCRFTTTVNCTSRLAARL